MVVLSRLTAISGGIGSGKSVVSRMLEVKGFRVYDCDSRAKALMSGDPEIRRRLAEEITLEALTPSGELNRKAIAAEVFADPEKLGRLNGIVHGAVLHDIEEWYLRHVGEGKRLFVETAILYQSGLDAMVGEVWEVTAPEEVRLKRAIRRDQADEASVRARIEAQVFEPECPHGNVKVIVNDGIHAVLPQLNLLLNRH